MNTLFAATALAAPRGNAGLASRMQRRGFGARQSLPNKKSPTITNQTNVEYSENWSGAIITSPPSGETRLTAALQWKTVTGTFTVPTPSKPSGSSNEEYWAASAWVGIDGDTCETAILQAGIDFIITESGEYEYDAWYEWYPDYAYDFDLTVSAGDVIKTTVEATSLKAGTATIENVTTGKTVSISLSSSSSLCGENAEWIVEDFESGSELVALADFGTVTFTDCSAATSETSEGVSDATVIDIESDEGKVLTSVTLESSSEIVVTYV
ncbi:aspergillopepsin-2 precursor protein [Rutstroemia sp. NJR-2017a BVV2]|nr:aspergillopepsin-2 precursor protein [Rutstroemia sp. NJR-2017a BVV2]